MTAVNGARNLLKHSGILPLRSEIQRLTRATHEFLVDGSRIVFDVDFDTVSMSDLIPGDAVRGHVKDAERELAAGDLNAAAVNAALAFESLMRGEPPSETSSADEWHQWERRNRFTFDTTFFLNLREPMERKFAEAWDRVIAALVSNEFAIRLLSKGISNDDFLRFESLTPTVHRMMGQDEPVSFVNLNVKLTAEDASWCIEFVIRSALAIAN